jgi:hypothetical protein
MSNSSKETSSLKAAAGMMDKGFTEIFQVRALSAFPDNSSTGGFFLER